MQIMQQIVQMLLPLGVRVVLEFQYCKDIIGYG